jgi:hypothetical protein
LPHLIDDRSVNARDQNTDGAGIACMSLPAILTQAVPAKSGIRVMARIRGQGVPGCELDGVSANALYAAQ